MSFEKAREERLSDVRVCGLRICLKSQTKTSSHLRMENSEPLPLPSLHLCKTHDYVQERMHNYPFIQVTPTCGINVHNF